MSLEYTCNYCGAKFAPFKLPPHTCDGLIAAQAKVKEALAPLPTPRLERTPIVPGDTVEWTERTGAGRHDRKQGVVSHVLENGKVVLIRVGATLVEKNMGQVTRIARKRNCGAQV